MIGNVYKDRLRHPSRVCLVTNLVCDDEDHIRRVYATVSDSSHPVPIQENNYDIAQFNLLFPYVLWAPAV